MRSIHVLLLLLGACLLAGGQPLSLMIDDLEEENGEAGGSPSSDSESGSSMNQALCSFNLQQIVNFIARLAFGIQGAGTWCPLGEAYKEACISSVSTVFIAISQIAAGLADAAATCSTTLDVQTQEEAECGGGAAGIVTPLATFVAGGSTVAASCDAAAGLMGKKRDPLPKGLAVDRRLTGAQAEALGLAVDRRLTGAQAEAPGLAVDRRLTGAQAEALGRRLLQLLTEAPAGQVEGRGQPEPSEVPDDGASEPPAPAVASTSTAPAPTTAASTSSSSSEATSLGPAEIPPAGAPGANDAARQDLSQPWQKTEGAIDTTSGAMSMGQLATSVSQAVSACPVAGQRRLQQEEALCTKEISFAIFSLSRIITFMSLAVAHLAPDDMPYAMAQCCAGVSALAGSMASAVSYSAQIYADCVATSSQIPTEPTTSTLTTSSTSSSTSSTSSSTSTTSSSTSTTSSSTSTTSSSSTSTTSSSSTSTTSSSTSTTSSTRVRCCGVTCPAGTVNLPGDLWQQFGSTPEECCQEACSSVTLTDALGPVDSCKYNLVQNSDQVAISTVESCWQENCHGFFHRGGCCNPGKRLQKPWRNAVITGWYDGSAGDYFICCEDDPDLVKMDLPTRSCATPPESVCADPVHRCVCDDDLCCDYTATCQTIFSTCPTATSAINAAKTSQTICQATCLQCKVDVCDGGCKCWDSDDPKLHDPHSCFCRFDRTAMALIHKCPQSHWLQDWIQAALSDPTYNLTATWCATSDEELCEGDDSKGLAKCKCDRSHQCDWIQTCKAAVEQCPRSSTTTRWCQAAVETIPCNYSWTWCASEDSDVCNGQCLCHSHGLCDLASTYKKGLELGCPCRWCTHEEEPHGSCEGSSAFKCVTVCGDDSQYLIAATLGEACGGAQEGLCPVAKQRASGLCDRGSVFRSSADPLNWCQAPEEATCKKVGASFKCEFPSHPCSCRRLGTGEDSTEIQELAAARRLGPDEDSTEIQELAAARRPGAGEDSTKIRELPAAQRLGPDEDSAEIQELAAALRVAPNPARALRLHAEMWLAVGFNLSDPQAPWLTQSSPGIRRIVERGQRGIQQLHIAHGLIPEVADVGAPAEDEANERPLELPALDSETLACSVVGRYYTPFGFRGHGVSFEVGVAACQARCAAVSGCAYFSFYVPERHCHLHDVLAEPAADQYWVGGPAGCRPEHISEATQRLLQRTGSCYFQHSGYEPKDAVRAPSTVQSAVQCQQQCQQVPTCASFSFAAGTGLCHLVPPGARRLGVVVFSVAGPRRCSGASLLGREARPPPGRQQERADGWAFSAVGIAVLFAMALSKPLLRWRKVSAGRGLEMVDLEDDEEEEA